VLDFLFFFALCFLEDVLSASYTKLVNLNRPFLAGLDALAIFLLGIFVLSQLIFDLNFLSPKLWGAGLGSFCGTYCLVKFAKKWTGR